MFYLNSTWINVLFETTRLVLTAYRHIKLRWCGLIIHTSYSIFHLSFFFFNPSKVDTTYYLGEIRFESIKKHKITVTLVHIKVVILTNLAYETSSCKYTLGFYVGRNEMRKSKRNIIFFLIHRINTCYGNQLKLRKRYFLKKYSNK